MKHIDDYAHNLKYCHRLLDTNFYSFPAHSKITQSLVHWDVTPKIHARKLLRLEKERVLVV